jgi:2-haloacid dehalogenase
VLATLSNGDAAMLRALLARLPVPFDHIISSEGGRFKPHPSVYRKALETLGVEAAEWLHVAGSATDAMGATASGIRTLWINRFDEVVDDPRFGPAHQAADLRGVLNVLDASPS